MLEVVKTGIPGLDQILNGGFLKGSAYIVQGPPGAGKTVMGNQFCFHQARNGAKALYVTLLAESHKRMLSYMRELTFYAPDAVPANLQFVSGFSALERGGMVELIKLIQHELRRHQAQFLVVDGLFVVEDLGSPGEFRKFVHELQGVANYNNAVLLALTHRQAHPATPEQTMVDGWILLDEEVNAMRSTRTIQVVKHRGVGMLPGRHTYRISAEGASIFPRVESTLRREHADVPEPGEAVSSGLPVLDRMLGGGLPKASATLVIGPTGSGKTTLGLHFISRATPEAPAIMVGFHEVESRIRARARDLGMELKEMIDSGAAQVVWWPPAESLVDEVVHDLLQRVRQTGAKRVFLDGLVSLRNSLYFKERLPYILNALNHHLRAQDLTILYSDEHQDLTEARAAYSGEMTAVTDNLIELRYNRGSAGSSRGISVVKLRNSGFEDAEVPFAIYAGGLKFGSSK